MFSWFPEYADAEIDLEGVEIYTDDAMTVLHPTSWCSRVTIKDNKDVDLAIELVLHS